VRLPPGQFVRSRFGFWVAILRSCLERIPLILKRNTYPPSENSRHLADFQGTLELTRDFGPRKTKLRLVYALIDDAKGVLLGTALIGWSGQWPIHDQRSDPPWLIYDDPFTPVFAKLLE
jgi:hypothetical protein